MPNASLIPMELKINKMGRQVVPKEIRDCVALKPGDPFVTPP